MKLTIANDSEETSQTMKQKMGNPADEEKMNVKDRTFDLLLYNKESNTMIDQDMVFVLDDNGCLLQFPGYLSLIFLCQLVLPRQMLPIMHSFLRSS